jgi:DNA-binding transcriptional LysR family regulator
VAVIPAGHLLAAKTEVTADELRAQRFVAIRSEYLMYRFAHRLFGPDLLPEFHSTDGAEMGKMMVAAGIGMTILPDYSVRRHYGHDSRGTPPDIQDLAAGARHAAPSPRSRRQRFEPVRWAG